jgi:putative transcriptional regulator
MTIKIKLKEIRTQRGFSQNELARRLKMSLANIQKIEYSKAKSIPLDTLDKLCSVLQCQPSDLLEYVNDTEGEIT